MTKKDSTIRKLRLLTLSRADRSERSIIEKKMIAERIRRCFKCVSIEKQIVVIYAAVKGFCDRTLVRIRPHLPKFLILIFFLLLLYSIFLCLDSISLFHTLMSKAGVSLLGRALSICLSRCLGWDGGLLLVGILSFFASYTAVNMVAPSGTSGAESSSSWKEDSFELQVLLEPFSETDTSEGASVNQPQARPVPPANPVASPGEEAGPSNLAPPAAPYPYQPDEIIGGDSVLSIQNRLLLRGLPDLPFEQARQMAFIRAQDLFEVKVDILKSMAQLDPQGEGFWLGHGARALENPRTATGEERLETLHGMLAELQSDGVNSAAFKSLSKKKVFFCSVDDLRKDLNRQ